jgi:hypothetical protein
MNAVDKRGRRRLDIPTDFVRREIELALNLENVLVVPILVDGAPLPSAAELPPSLTALSRRNGITMSYGRFTAGSVRLLQAVERTTTSP